jgi:hypothetical protein
MCDRWVSALHSMDVVEFYAFSRLMTFSWDGSGGISEDAVTNDSGKHVWYDVDEESEDVHVRLSPATITIANVTILAAIVLAMSWIGNCWVSILHFRVLGVVLCLLFLDDLPMGEMQMRIQKPTQLL